MVVQVLYIIVIVVPFTIHIILTSKFNSKQFETNIYQRIYSNVNCGASIS